MPIYSYTCPGCAAECEQIVSTYRQAASPPDALCDCGQAWQRQGVELPSVGKKAYQMAAILKDGTHVPGHFGKTAKNKFRRSVG